MKDEWTTPYLPLNREREMQDELLVVSLLEREQTLLRISAVKGNPYTLVLLPILERCSVGDPFNSYLVETVTWIPESWKSIPLESE